MSVRTASHALASRLRGIGRYVQGRLPWTIPWTIKVTLPFVVALSAPFLLLAVAVALYASNAGVLRPGQTSPAQIFRLKLNVVVVGEPPLEITTAYKEGPAILALPLAGGRLKGTLEVWVTNPSATNAVVTASLDHELPRSLYLTGFGSTQRLPAGTTVAFTFQGSRSLVAPSHDFSATLVLTSRPE